MSYNIAIVGATGLVGQTFLEVLAEGLIPVKNIKLFASSKSAGKIITFLGKPIKVEELTATSFVDIDFAFFSAGGSISLKWANIATNSGAIVIDNSSAWRMNDLYPLVVPEVNAIDIKNNKLIANPNCSTIQSVIPLKALADKYTITSVNFTTYQATSGSGYQGINDLKATLDGKAPEFYPYNISETCIPLIDDMLENGYTKEEMKMIFETRKILHLPNLPISATCIRVPVQKGHGVSIRVTLTQEIDLKDIIDTLDNFDGLQVIKNNNSVPVTTMVIGTNNVLVGRIRIDYADPKTILLYVVADNIRKGAAGNAIQIAQSIINQRSV
ncbi:MAG: aspartate-semialdehyde dehydrogenase [Candidatus Izemoplasma sp.]